MWTNKYIEILDELCDNGFIKNYKTVKDGTDGQTPLFELIFQREVLKKYEDNIDGLLENLKLVSKISINNMHLICDSKIKKYNSAEEICDDFFNKRLEIYGMRKNYKLNSLKIELNKTSETARFIELVINDKIKIYKRKKDDIVKDLEKNNFDVELHNYLLSLSIISLTKEKLDDLLQQKIDKSEETKKLELSTLEEL
jgi:DNA topoisomerase-2